MIICKAKQKSSGSRYKMSRGLTSNFTGFSQKCQVKYPRPCMGTPMRYSQLWPELKPLDFTQSQEYLLSETPFPVILAFKLRACTIFNIPQSLQKLLTSLVRHTCLKFSFRSFKAAYYCPQLLWMSVSWSMKVWTYNPLHTPQVGELLNQQDHLAVSQLQLSVLCSPYEGHHVLLLPTKGLAKLGNIVAETMFLVMSPGVAKLGNICFGRNICVREAKMFLTPWQKHFLFPSSKICFRNTCFPSG